MKKNLMIGMAIVGGVGLAGWMGYKTFKKELKKARVEKQPKNESSSEEQQQQVIGEKPEEKKEENNSYLEPADFVADLALKAHNVFDDEVLNIQSALSKSGHTIHVRKMNKSLDLLLQVPTEGVGVPNMGEFTTALKDATEITWKEHVKFVDQPFGQFEAWFIINWTDVKGVRRSGMARVPKDIRNKFRKTSDEGTIIKEKPAFVESRCVRRINDGVKIGIEENDSMKDPKIVKAILLWRISYYIGNKKYAGINLETATSCLKYLVEEFSIESREAVEFTYDNVVFYNSEYPGITVWTFKEDPKGYRMLEAPIVYAE